MPVLVVTGEDGVISENELLVWEKSSWTILKSVSYF
jgi:hypothetical protein